MPCVSDWIETPETLRFFQDTLTLWGRENFREFPWRLTNDPYVILLAEVMLHRTQVNQVLPIFNTFIAQYPDILSLAKANQYELKATLSSLGLQWRIDLIFLMAQQILEKYSMQIPQEKGNLISLPGINEYIAGAVRCFAWNFPEPLIDTNTVRITGRLFDLEIKDSSRRNSKFRNLINAMVDPVHPRDYNYALLDLAHMICMKKQAPLCKECPVQILCCYGQGSIKRP